MYELFFVIIYNKAATQNHAFNITVLTNLSLLITIYG